MPEKSLFDELYKRLNPAQKEAVDTIEGPVMVIAGPGTGKTQILTLRIANILQKTDTPPDAILALTFTESGVSAMRRRLLDIIGSPAYRVHIHTFHSFCGDLIRSYPDEYPNIIGADLITDIDKLSLLKEIILSAELSHLRPFGDNFYYVEAVRGAISELKRENISPEELAARIEKQKRDFKEIEDLYHEKGAHKGKMKGKHITLEKKIAKNEELARLYARYQELIRERHSYDYDDMIMETVAALEHDENFQREIQEQFLYLLADEHQDANASQNKILELLSSFHDNPNLFIVGDEKQAIFRFQGASLENFLYFKRQYPDAKLIALEHNYRSSQSILDSAHSLTEKGGDVDPELRKKLKGTRGEGTPIEIRSFSNESYELCFVARDTRQKIKEGILGEEIAVLYRTNRDAAAIAAAMERENVPFMIESDQNVLADLDIQKFLALLRAVDAFGDDAYLAPLLYLDLFGIAPLDIYKALAAAHPKKLPLYDLIHSEPALEQAKIENPSAFLNLYASLEGWCQNCRNKPLLECLEKIVEESGLLAKFVDDAQAQDKLDKLNSFFGDAVALVEAHRDLTLSQFLEYLALLEENNIMIRKHASAARKGAVRLMTAHKSKGLEFDWVYITGARDGHWGNRKGRDKFDLPITESDGADENDDERRLFYVALTRARVGASISYAEEGQTGREQAPSLFLGEIDESLVQHIDTAKFESSIPKETLVSPRTKHAQPLHEREFLRSLFAEQGLSVTAINNYLACPWNYFFNSLLRVPRAKNKHALFGTAVHGALHQFFERMKNGERPGREELIRMFEYSLSRLPLSAHDFKELEVKGKKALGGYYDEYHPGWNAHVLTELKITAHLPIDLPGIAELRLRGDLDKLELSKGEAGDNVRVIDYKTGSTKSRNAIEGKTKSESGDYKRQLVFYKLLLSLYENGRYRMNEGVIDFVEPDISGKYKREVFVIETSEIEEMMRTIKSISESIFNLSFWDERCDEPNCQWCALREKMSEKLGE